MNKRHKAKTFSSQKLQELLDEVTPLEMAQTKVKMQLASRIEDTIREKGWSKSQFAEKAGKNRSEISKWLSGTQNFTVDTLTEISFVLGVDLKTLFDKNQDQMVYRTEVRLESVAIKSDAGLTPFVVQDKDATDEYPSANPILELSYSL